MPAAVRGVLGSVQGVRTVSGVRFTKAIVSGADRPTVTGVDPATLGEVFNVRWVDGSAATLRALGPGELLLAKRWAQDHRRGRRRHAAPHHADRRAADV